MSKASFLNHAYSALVIIASLALGYGINAIFDFLPAALYGMLLLTFALQAELVNPHKLRASVDWIIKHMGVCFVPAGVGIMEHEALITEFGIVLAVLVVFTTMALLLVIGFLYQRQLTNPKAQINR